MHGSRYGELVPRDRSQCHIWNFIGYTRARLVLEAQAYLLHFLRNVADALILPESKPSGCTQWQAQLMKGFKAPGGEGCGSTFGSQAFSAPPVFEPHSILANVKAQLSTAEDHLRYVQTDPAYFQSLLTKMRRGEIFATMTASRVWELIASEFMLYPIQDVRELRNPLDECKHLVGVYDDCKREIKLGNSLPKAYDRALGAIELLCGDLYHDARKRLEFLLRRLPGFSANYRYERRSDGKYCSRLRDISQDVNFDGNLDAVYFREEPLHWVLLKLCDDPQNPQTPNISFVMGFIEDRLAHSSAKEAARVDQILYDHLSRMALFGELVTAVRLHRPGCGPFSYEIATAEEKSRSTWRLWNCIPKNLSENETRDLSRLLRAFYEQRWSSGKPNQSWLDRATEVRSRQSAFWNNCREIRRREVADIGFTNADIEEDLALLDAASTDDYERELRAERQMVDDYVASQNRAKKTNDASHEVQTTWGSTNEPSFDLPVARIKPKTRAELGDTRSLADGNVLDSEDKTSRSHILVDASSLQIFAKIFPDRTGPTMKGLVKWQQFVSAMGDAGLSAIHRGGSAVAFEQDANAGGGTIVLHKPHPDSSLDPITMQIIGKRLKKWFGWDGGIFVERKKDES